MKRALWPLSALPLAGCFAATPATFDEAVSGASLGAVRVLAVVADPPEVAPGATVSITALLAYATPISSGSLNFSVCHDGVPLAESSPVARSCLAPRGQAALDAIASAPYETAAPNAHTTRVTVAFTVPRDACARFGSTPAPGARPTDADATGGFYLPVRVDGPSISVGRVRLRCPLTNAPADVVRQFAANYRVNRAPSWTLAAGETPGALRLSARDADEAYLRYQGGDALEGAREHAELRVFSVTNGEITPWVYAVESSRGDGTAGRDEFLFERPPGKPLWIVLADDRGGVHAENLE